MKGLKKNIFCKMKQGVIHLVYTQNFPNETNISYHLIQTRIRMCAYKGARNVNSWENFAYVLNERPPGQLILYEIFVL